MLRGLWKLTWIEMKVFLREPLGAFGTIGVPVLIFVVLGRVANLKAAPPSLAFSSGFSGAGSSGSCVAFDRCQRRAFAGYHHLHLPRGRHSQAASRHAASPQTPFSPPT